MTAAPTASVPEPTGGRRRRATPARGRACLRTPTRGLEARTNALTTAKSRGY